MASASDACMESALASITGSKPKGSPRAYKGALRWASKIQMTK